MTSDSTLQAEARYLAQQFFAKEPRRSAEFTASLLDIYNKAQGKDFLVIHNPGGLGNKNLAHCFQWERSVVDGVCTTMGKLGHTWVLIQHFRTSRIWRERIRYIKELFRLSAIKANILAAELNFILQHIDTLKVILVGVSQGAAFGNLVMQHLTEPHRVYSVELGMIVTHKRRRVITERTLAIDGNGLMPDAMMEWNIMAVFKAFLVAPFRWLKYRITRKPMNFWNCVNVPGHEYNWNYPEVGQQIGSFLEANFGNNIE